MKMGRLVLVLSLAAVGVGCSRSESGKRTEDTDKVRAAANGPCEVTKVEKWDPSGSAGNRKLHVPAGDTVFVFGEQKSMRARLHSHKTRDYVVPLKELRNEEDKALFFGVAPGACWSSWADGGVELMCVRCRQNVVPSSFWEPCCPVN